MASLARFSSGAVRSPMRFVLMDLSRRPTSQPKRGERGRPPSSYAMDLGDGVAFPGRKPSLALAPGLSPDVTAAAHFQRRAGVQGVVAIEAIHDTRNIACSRNEIFPCLT